MYKTGNTKFDEKVALALKKDPLTKSKLATLHEEVDNEAPKENKYNVGAKGKRTYKGIVFASIKEMDRYKELELEQKAHKLADLAIQVHFNLMQGFYHRQYGRVNGIDYVADFVYRALEGEFIGRVVVEDAKGVRTPEFLLKRKLFLKIYPEYIFIEV